MAKRSSLAKQHLQLTSARGITSPATYGASPLRTRTRLRERRPVSVRRHSARIATRLSVLLVCDTMAIAAIEMLAAIASTSLTLGKIGTDITRAHDAGYGVGVNFALAVIGSLVITG